jgi:hypothetical protein
LSHVWRVFAAIRSSHGFATVGLVAIIGAFVGGAALGAVLVVSGAVDPMAESAISTPSSTMTASTVPALVALPSTVSALTANLQLLDCREGQPVGSVIDGDSVYVVGVEESGEWVAVRRPGALAEVGWLPISFLEYDQDLSVVPVIPCGEMDSGADVSVGDTSSTTTTTAPTDTTIPPPDTTLPPDTTIPPPDTTLPPETIPPDTDAPIVKDLIVVPEVIYPGAGANGCENGASTPTSGSAYATITNEPDPVTATLTWEYQPTDFFTGSGNFSVSVEPGTSTTQLIGSIIDLPQAYGPASTPFNAVVELTWTVTDSAGNTTTVDDEFDLGRCFG